MEFLKTIGKAVGEAAAYLGEKNHRAAQLSRIRSFIRCQEKAAEKEYLALGRYYYHNLRDKENDVTEAHCLALDEIGPRRPRGNPRPSGPHPGGGSPRGGGPRRHARPGGRKRESAL